MARDFSRHSFGSAFFLLCALSTGCASGGSGTLEAARQTETRGVLGAGYELTTDAAVRDTVISAARSDVWSVLPSVFETLEVEATSVDPRSRRIGNPEYHPRRIEGKLLSRYLQCGSSITRPNADQYDVTLQVMVELEGAPGGGTVVRVLIDAYARSRNVRGNAIHCTSKGTLERRIVELVREELTGA